MAPLLRASGLECVRGDRRLFSDISFVLSAGTLLQVRGANGSGKTSLLRIVCGLLRPDAGEVAWEGRPVGELGEDYRRQLCYVGHLNAIKDELTPGENLRHAAKLAGIAAAAAEIEGALHGFGLGARERLPCKLLSQGQRRRAALSRLALARSRPLWVLDEPFAALDAEGVALARQLVDAHLKAGGIALMTTHQDAGPVAGIVQSVELGP